MSPDKTRRDTLGPKRDAPLSAGAGAGAGAEASQEALARLEALLARDDLQEKGRDYLSSLHRSVKRRGYISERDQGYVARYEEEARANDNKRVREPPRPWGPSPSLSGGATSKSPGGAREAEKEPPLPYPLPAGFLLEGRYRIERMLGEGAFATVYAARHVGLQSLHAIKILHPDIARMDATVRSRFLDEGRIQANLRHPNIVGVSEIITEPLPGLVLEYVDGPNLYEYVATQGGRLGVPETQELMASVLRGVARAHSEGVVHRDLKPENILIGRSEDGGLQPKIADFGIAKALEESPFDSGKRRTRAGDKPMGTLLYLSPEQIRSPTEVDQRSDVFALGAILYELLTGAPAFDAGNEYEVMDRIINGGYRPAEELVPGLPQHLSQCIRNALHPDPAQRLQSADAFLALLLAKGVQQIPAQASQSGQPRPQAQQQSISPESGNSDPAHSSPPSPERSRLHYAEEETGAAPVKDRSLMWIGIVAGFAAWMLAGGLVCG